MLILSSSSLHWPCFVLPDGKIYSIRHSFILLHFYYCFLVYSKFILIQFHFWFMFVCVWSLPSQLAQCFTFFVLFCFTIFFIQTFWTVVVLVETLKWLLLVWMNWINIYLARHFPMVIWSGCLAVFSFQHFFAWIVQRLFCFVYWPSIHWSSVKFNKWKKLQSGWRIFLVYCTWLNRL